MHPERFFAFIISFAVGACSLDPGEYKPCFERYNGYRLVGVQPFHNEWRILSEENCLEFCAKTASRCASIVFDKKKHICHYFSTKGHKGNGIVRHSKFLYLQSTSRHCLEEKLLSSDDQKPVTKVQKPEDQTAESEPISTMQKESDQSMSIILDRIDAELKEQTDYNASSFINSKEAQMAKRQSVVSQENNGSKFLMRMQKLALVKKPEREIRRYPTRNGDNGNILEEQGDNEKQQNVHFVDEGEKTTEERLPIIYDCDPGSNLIWMAVENSHFNATTKEKTVTKKAESAKHCIGACDNLKIGEQFCNTFSFDEQKLLCHFTHSGNSFPNSLINSNGFNFTQRSFRRFCYPGTFSAFDGCSEFVAFTDYKLELEPRETFDGLSSNANGISACIELCVLSSGFKCMSGLFDQSKGICHLYSLHSLAQPSAFQSHANAGQLYFENGCADSIKDVLPE